MHKNIFLRRIVVSVTNDLVTDQRVYKVCKSLQKLDFDILLIGRKLKNSPPIDRPYSTYRMRLLFNKGALFYAEYNIRLFIKLLFTKKDILLANDLDTLLPNYLISQFQKKKLVYDSHELFSELPSVQGRFSQNIWRYLEKKLLPNLKYFFTVSDSIADWYSKAYDIKPLVLKNLPEYKNTPFINPKEKYILYQGALNNGRGLIPLLEAMQTVDQIKLKIAGKGPFKKDLDKAIIQFNIEDKVEFLGNIHPTELVKITQNATIGISLEEDLGLSYRYSLPNKLFDYIQAKTPILATNLPEIKKVITKFEIGEIIKNHSPKNISIAINKMISNGKPYYQNNLEKASKELIWENQTGILLSVYNNV